MGFLIVVITTIFNIIVRILTFIAKLVYKLVKLLGLQFPVVYVGILLIVDLCTNHSISSVPERMSLFWVGFVLSLVCSAAWVIRKVFFPKRKRDEAYYRKKFEREQQQLLEQERRRAETEARAQFESGRREDVGAVSETPSVPEPPKPAILFEPIPAEVPVEHPAPLPPEPQRPEHRKKIRYPLVYRVKQDERFLIYEYEDRIDLYFEKPSGLKFIKSDKK